MGIGMHHEAAAREQSAGLPVRKIGLIGGMSWRSTALYYERLNLGVERRFGPHHSFEGVIWTLNYASLLAAARRSDWNLVKAMVCEAAMGLAHAACDVVVLTAVTAHLFRDAVAEAANRPVLHVLSGAARELDRLGIRRVGVLGTTATCGASFLDDYLGGNDRAVLRLDPDRQRAIETLIQDVLTTGSVDPDSAGLLRKSVILLRDRGAQAVVLACTELPLLLPISETDVPIIDSVALHVEDICNAIASEDHAG
jgi:aspartate racemase